MQVRYDERGSREEEWLKLGRSRFSWLTEPAAGCPSNPTVVQGLTPTGKDAVDHKVSLAWPCMVCLLPQLAAGSPLAHSREGQDVSSREA